MNITLTSHVAWWLKYYLAGVSFAAKVTGSDVNMDRVIYWTCRAVTVRVDDTPLSNTD